VNLRTTKSGANALCALALALVCAIAHAQSSEPIKPIPSDVKVDEKKAALGEKLFSDKRLSKDNTVACVSCHGLSTGGVDRAQVSTGVGGSKGPINAPTVFNAGFNFRQFWDGRASSLEEQAMAPIHNPKEMGSNWQEVLAKLSADKDMVAAFKAAFPDGLQAKNIQSAIAEFQRTLNTPNSKFDRYLKGDKNALSADEQKGYQLFKNYGCIACHQGVNVGGNMYQVFGVMGDYFKQRGNMTEADLGRYNVTKNDADKHMFKVPSLRNVAMTPPYFHDGTIKTLPEAVEVMFRYQLGRSAPQSDKDLIVKFLQTLTGEYKGKPLDVASK
jgi:cytochrome c peroxidase